jgi:hypothetical protein
VAIVIYIPTNSGLFLSPTVFVDVCFLDDSDWGELESECFDCVSFMVKDGEQFFMYLLAFVLLLLRTVQFLCPFIT